MFFSSGVGNTSTSESAEKTVSERTIEKASYKDVYTAYQENTVNAEDLYKGKWFKITAEINQINNDMAPLSDDIVITCQKKIDSTLVFFYARFPQTYREDIKKLKAGDKITFIGKCKNADNWTDCDLVQ